MNIYVSHKLVWRNNQKALLWESDRSLLDSTPATHKLLICTGFTFLIAQVVWLVVCVRMMIGFFSLVVFFFFQTVYSHQNHWHPSCWEEEVLLTPTEKNPEPERTENAAGMQAKCMGCFIMRRVASRGSESTQSGCDTEWQVLILTAQPPCEWSPSLEMVGKHFNKLVRCKQESSGMFWFNICWFFTDWECINGECNRTLNIYHSRE